MLTYASSKVLFTRAAGIGDCLLVTYVNECLTNQRHSMGRTLNCFWKGIYTLILYIAFTQSHRPEKAIGDSDDKCETGLRLASSPTRTLKSYGPPQQWPA